LKNFKYKITKDDTFDSISRAVSNEALTMARDEMSDRIYHTPKVTVIDYNKGPHSTNLDETEKTPSGKNPYDMYGHVADNGVISSEKVTPERAHYVNEIRKDGSQTLSTREDFEKKVAAQSVNDEDLTELSRVVRVTSRNAEDYANSDNRSSEAYKAFDNHKYLIEETAARRGLPPALLSSVYFKTMADNGSLNEAAPSVFYAKRAYNRLYGQVPALNDEALAEYLKTPEGMLDFIAIGLRSEAKYFGYNTALLNEKQMVDLLSEYGGWIKSSPDFASTVMAYNSVFDNIYKKLPSKDYEVTLI